MVATPSDFRVDPERTELTDGRSLTLKAARNVLRQLTEGGFRMGGEEQQGPAPVLPHREHGLTNASC